MKTLDLAPVLDDANNDNLFLEELNTGLSSNALSNTRTEEHLRYSLPTQRVRRPSRQPKVARFQHQLPAGARLPVPAKTGFARAPRLTV